MRKVLKDEFLIIQGEREDIKAMRKRCEKCGHEV
jgi:hypothetical protein